MRNRQRSIAGRLGREEKCDQLVTRKKGQNSKRLEEIRGAERKAGMLSGGHY